MLRKDYDQLMILANQFTFPYFLQSTFTEKKLYRPHAQLRNSNTTGYIDEDKYRDINKGIFIDIFPLDGVSELEEENRKQRKIYDRYNRILSKFNTAMDYKPETSIIKKFKKKLKKEIFAVIKKEYLFKKFENNLRKYSQQNVSIWGNRTIVFECPKSRRPINDWQNLTSAKFEFLNVPIPINYDGILKQQYGDYMKFPRNKKGSMHGTLTISTEYSYTKK